MRGEPAVATRPEVGPADHQRIADRLGDVRRRTLELVGALDWETLRRQHIAILSPMVWDLGHIANFEEQWIGQRLAGSPPLVEGLQRMFDPVANPRPTRAALPPRSSCASSANRPGSPPCRSSPVSLPSTSPSARCRRRSSAVTMSSSWIRPAAPT